MKLAKHVAISISYYRSLSKFMKASKDQKYAWKQVMIKKYGNR